MLPNEAKDVVLRLLNGRSEQRELVLRGGRERPPFAVGQESAWRVEAGHVAAAHVMLAFNGATLYVCALPGEKALLDGEPLRTRWVEAAVPSDLRFGGARLSIGGRAGPEEETQLPAPRPSRDEEITCFDEDRLRAALAASIPNGEITFIAEVEIPAAARRPHVPIPAKTRGPLPVAPPVLADRARTLAAPPIAELADSARTQAAPPIAEVPGPRTSDDEQEDDEEAPSTMPPTSPSDGLLAMAPPSFSFGRTFAAVRSEPGPARPSSPTIAIPFEPPASPRVGDSLAAIESSALAISGENTAGPLPAQGGGPRGRVLEAWQQASGPRRLLAVLLAPAVIGGLLTLRSAPAPSHPSPGADTAVTRDAVGPEGSSPAATPVAAAPVTATPDPATKGVAAPTPAQATPPDRPKSAVGLHETRTAERRALDTVASGLDSAAADQYEALAAAHPENVAFREAARILRARGATARH